MAENPDKVYAFMNDLWPSALDMAKSERDALAEELHADGVEGELIGGDWRYYVEKVRAKRYNFNEEEMRPYFEFTAVRDGAFELATKLFGLQFKELNDLPKWLTHAGHPKSSILHLEQIHHSYTSL